MKRLFLSMITLVALFSAVVAGPLVAPSTASAACAEKSFFGVPPWYRGLTTGSGSDCTITKPSNLGQFITKIALNLLQAALVVMGYIAIFFIIKGGINYMTSMGTPDKMASARKTIMNAIIGLVIALLSAVIVNYIMGIL